MYCEVFIRTWFLKNLSLEFEFSALSHALKYKINVKSKISVPPGVYYKMNKRTLGSLVDANFVASKYSYYIHKARKGTIFKEKRQEYQIHGANPKNLYTPLLSEMNNRASFTKCFSSNRLLKWARFTLLFLLIIIDHR